MFEPACPVCSTADTETLERIARLRQDGTGAEGIWNRIDRAIPRKQLETHVRHVPRGAATKTAEDADTGRPVDGDWLSRHGIEAPGDGLRFVAATVEVGDGDRRHWVRVRPDEDSPECERVEIRQAQPVTVEPPLDRRGSLVLLSPGRWQTWIASPDAQIGFFVDRYGVWHTTHDERAFDIGHQIAAAVAEDCGLHGWIDPGDFADLAAPSRYNPTATDLHVEGLNRTWQRGSEEFARRRWAVGETGEVVLLEGNHDLRLKRKAAQEMPYLVGMRRAGDDDEEHPVLSVPYLMRAREYGVEWVAGYPDTYRRLNENLAVFHAPAYGSKALDTARKIAARVHMSVYHGHTHRREALAETVEGRKGGRTMEIWSDGTWGRVDGGLPAGSNAYDDYLDRMTAGSRPEKVGQLAATMHQGMSVIHVEVGGRDRFSAERIAFWDGWSQWRGQTFEASCDADGNQTGEAA